MTLEPRNVQDNNPNDNSTVFFNLGCEVSQKIGKFWQRDRKSSENKVILYNVSGAIRSGRLTFILGPSGAGKTTLLQILAGRKKTGVTGSVHGAGGNVVLVSQHAELIEVLTAKETLTFAARLKLPHHKPRERKQAIENVAKQLGIHDALNTRAGRLSGGERKRLTIACELLTDPNVMLLDEPTSGLDSVSSLSVMYALQGVARSGRTVACVVHQPSSKLFACAEDVILLANGKTLYCGAVATLPQTLAKAELACPQYYNMADYLLEVATNDHKGNLFILEREVRNYACEMKEVAKYDSRNKKGKDFSPETEALLVNNSPYHNRYAASTCQQLSALFWRGFICVMRDVHLTQIRLAAHVVVALLLGALYNGAGAEAHRVHSNAGCLFFFLLFLFFSNAMPTIHTFPAESTVVLQQHLNKWYSLFTYCISKIVVDLPIQLLCATVFLFPAWYLTSQPLEIHRMAMAWMLCVLLIVLAQTLGLVFGAACGVKLALFAIPAVNIPMLMFSEFFIPYREMPIYLRPFAILSYFRYAFDAILETVYGFDRPKFPCNVIYCSFKDPKHFLVFLGVPRHYDVDLWILALWTFFMQISLICVLLYRSYKACK